MANLKWDLRFLNLAQLVSTWSKDTSTQVGAVITDKDKRIISLGYNGLPSRIACGLEDSYLGSRETKYKSIIHAEINSILFAKQPLKDCCVYTYPFMPCSNCMSIVIQSGITRVVAPKLKPTDDRYLRWKDSFELSLQLARHAGIEVFEIDLDSGESENVEKIIISDNTNRIK